MYMDNSIDTKYNTDDLKIKRFYTMDSNNNNPTEDINMDTDMDTNMDTNMDNNNDNSNKNDETITFQNANLNMDIDEYKKLVAEYKRKRTEKELGITGNIFVDRLKERIRRLAEGKPKINLFFPNNFLNDTDNKSTGTIIAENLEAMKTNPGPGFNAPDNDIPLRAEIHKHLNYNYHIIKQFRYMNLETAVEQRNNYIQIIRTLNYKLENANIILSNLNKISNQEERIFTENDILFQIKKITETKNQSEAKILLINARIEFIQLKLEEIDRNNKNNK
jgi:hypothetical protein